MSVRSNSADRPSEEATNASNINSTDLVADELYSLVDAVDSESIADEFRIGLHSDKHDFTNHVKVAVREGLDPSSSLAELENKTAVDDSLEHMPKSRFSELTNDRDSARSFVSCSSYFTRHSCIINVRSSENDWNG